MQETEGVAVATYGTSQEFPAFFTPHSGFKAPYNVTNPTQAAHFIGMCMMIQGLLLNYKCNTKPIQASAKKS